MQYDRTKHYGTFDIKVSDKLVAACYPLPPATRNKLIIEMCTFPAIKPIGFAYLGFTDSFVGFGLGEGIVHQITILYEQI